ncbi:phage terminase large subunit family protein [Rhodomicrobium sp. Az07]|uniref:phage terminase large subunit family protein n=1 Tax=Rhodomicrobium sp. Az07 TaxID=2839034 RepID=UPI0020374866|nr:phage terminase large subunit family protein [Rhodomicrobium sp. Az07]
MAALPRIEWTKGAHTRNEGLDCRVYATAALHGLYAAGFDLNEAARRMADAPIRKAAPEEQRTAVLTAPKTIRSKWMNA